MGDSGRSIWEYADGLATLFACAAVTARTRMLDHASPLIRMMGQRDSLFAETSLLERELAIFRSQRHRIPAKQRPHYLPEARAEILQVMRLRSWSIKETAIRFVVHPNTIRKWRDAVNDRVCADRLLGGPPWNKLHGSVRWLVQEIRSAFPEPEFGTRTIARHIIRAGIKVSRTSVRRILQEEPECPKGKSMQTHVTHAPDHVRHPTRPNRVWHLDMTEVRVLWVKLEVAAILDGFTRKIIAIEVFNRRTTSADLVGLIGKVD